MDRGASGTGTGRSGIVHAMALDADQALPLAEGALRDRLAEKVCLDASGYCPRAEDNLVATVGPGVWHRARHDLAAGKGDELGGKFRAPYSSSALAVNTFGPLVDGLDLPGPLHVDGAIVFEQQGSAWARGYWPTLDVIVEAPGAPVRVFIESKCTEFLRKGEAGFSGQFVKHAKERLGDTAATTFEVLAAEAAAFDPLDARQLAKHFLAAKRAVVDSPDAFAVVLLCIWWEPQDAGNHPVFERHREAVRAFAAAIPDEDMTVGALTYRQLWEYWEALENPVLSRRTGLLRDRYDVPLNQPQI
jgi:hypothetical protein